MQTKKRVDQGLLRKTFFAKEGERSFFWLSILIIRYIYLDLGYNWWFDENNDFWDKMIRWEINSNFKIVYVVKN